jgi:hypothetical protein
MLIQQNAGRCMRSEHCTKPAGHPGFCVRTHAAAAAAAARKARQVNAANAAAAAAASSPPEGAASGATNSGGGGMVRGGSAPLVSADLAGAKRLPEASLFGSREEGGRPKRARKPTEKAGEGYAEGKPPAACSLSADAALIAAHLEYGHCFANPAAHWKLCSQPALGFPSSPASYFAPHFAPATGPGAGDEEDEDSDDGDYLAAAAATADAIAEAAASDDIGSSNDEEGPPLMHPTFFQLKARPPAAERMGAFPPAHPPVPGPNVPPIFVMAPDPSAAATSMPPQVGGISTAVHRGH